MFFFKCCMESQNDQGYIVSNSKDGKKNFISNFQLDSAIHNKTQIVKKFKKSKYKELIEKYKGSKQKWTDLQFPPNDRSLGNCQGVTKKIWKRISQILPKPVLFDSKIQPQDVVQGNLGDCYFLSALSALAQQQYRIKNIFGEQQKTANQNGIYKVTLLVNGQIQQILVDDYIPVNQYNQPLFCQFRNQQFWVLIIQKAWAKIHGSYQKIISGLPSQVLRAASHSPVKSFQPQKSQKQLQTIWTYISKGSQDNFPMCTGTIDDKAACSAKGLVHAHAYTLLYARQIEDNKYQKHRILKFRNPWGKKQWNGFGSDKDKFWNTVSQDQKRKINFLEDRKDDGIFHMNYQDFVKYFDILDICFHVPEASYFNQTIYPSKNATLFQFQVHENEMVIQKSCGEGKCFSYFQLHQPTLRGQSQARMQQGFSRATLILAQKTEDGRYKFINGKMSKEYSSLTLQAIYGKGKYVLYCKFDPTVKNNCYPTQSNISIFSKTKIILNTTSQKDHPDFLKKVFLEHARSNPDKTRPNELMWISKKLLYYEGGFAYIAFGNDIKSKKKFRISTEQNNFTKIQFKLKKPYKRKGNIEFEVLPGQQNIILCRFTHNPTTSKISFPPDINIKIEEII